MQQVTRRDVLAGAAGVAVAAAWPGQLHAAEAPADGLRLGLVTYQWGARWDLDTCLKHCAAAQVPGIELRTTHAHGVEPGLDKKQRAEVKRKFADSPVACVGPGSDERFDHPDPARLKQAITATRQFLQLSHDIGASGVKVKPDSFHKNVPREKTIEQIGKALGELAAFAENLGQEVRVEVHGSIGNDFEAMRDIMEIADHPRAVMCWNCNNGDLQGQGLEHHFNLIRQYFGQTAHVRELNIGNYPYQQLVDLLVRTNYRGWVLLECRRPVADPVKAMIEQRNVFEAMVAKAVG